VRSRFLCIRVASPNNEEAGKILQWYGKQAGWNCTPSRVRSILGNSVFGAMGAIHLGEMLLTAEASFLIMETTGKKIFNVYSTDRTKAAKELFVLLKEGNREKIRTHLENIYVNIPQYFRTIVFGDIQRMIFDICRKNKVSQEIMFKIVHATSEWDSRIGNGTAYPLLPAEAYLYTLCDILER
jgi:hypothetical protein